MSSGISGPRLGHHTTITARQQRREGLASLKPPKGKVNKADHICKDNGSMDDLIHLSSIFALINLIDEPSMLRYLCELASQKQQIRISMNPPQW